MYVNVISGDCLNYLYVGLGLSYVTFFFFPPFKRWGGKWWRVVAIHQCGDGISGECHLSIVLFEAHVTDVFLRCVFEAHTGVEYWRFILSKGDKTTRASNTIRDITLHSAPCISAHSR